MLSGMYIVGQSGAGGGLQAGTPGMGGSDNALT